MNKAIFVVSILLVAGLLIGGCTGANVADSKTGENSVSDSSPDSYIDEQIIDDTADVEIGEMI